jgi:RNA polymerase sigma-70 factor (ECF subfamily)
VDDQDQQASFERVVMPHLDAAYNLARWLAGNPEDARDVAQESLLRAFKFFGGFHGVNARAWLLAIVRNTFYTWIAKNRPWLAATSIDDQPLAIDEIAAEASVSDSPGFDPEAVRRALEELPVDYREIVVLREMEGLSYKEIAELAAIPIGTVMSRLARARVLLRKRLAKDFKPGERL